MEQQEKIDLINKLVEDYKVRGDNKACEQIIEMFKPFLLKNCKKFNDLFPGVHEWETIECEAMMILYQLIDEYTIGGTAYFNVFIMKKLPFRLRYFFIKEIKHRTRNLCHEEEQFMQYDTADVTLDLDVMFENVEDKQHLKMIKELVESDLLSDRDREMLALNMNGKSHDEIAKQYGISRSRVTKIIGNILRKIKKEIADYYEFSGKR